MSHRRIGIVVVGLAAWLFVRCAAAPPPVRAAGAGSVAVTITGFPSDEGQALLSLFLSADGFPGDPDRAFEAIERPIVDGRVEFVFRDVPAGSFAVSVFHDRDLDFELDTNFLGIPTESWGVSKDAAGFLGPPSFEQARLELADGEELEITFPVG